jgi:excisionase family DNA binding protein
MSARTCNPTLPGGLLQDRVVGKLESLEAMVGDLVTRKFPSLDARLKELRELLITRRKDHLVVEEIADLTGRSPYTVRRWISEGKLRAIRLRDGGPRGRLLIPRSELERIVAAGAGGNLPDTAVDPRSAAEE